MLFGVVYGKGNEEWTPKDTCHNGIGLCDQNINIVLDSMVDTIGKVNVIDLKNEKDFWFDDLWSLHLNFNCETWKTNHDSLQLVIMWDNSSLMQWSTMSVQCGVASTCPQKNYIALVVRGDLSIPFLFMLDTNREPALKNVKVKRLFFFHCTCYFWVLEFIPISINCYHVVYIQLVLCIAIHFHR